MKKFTPRTKLTLVIAAAVLVAFSAGYLLAMQLVSQGFDAPFAPPPAVYPVRGCQPRTSGAIYACPLIPAN